VYNCEYTGPPKKSTNETFNSYLRDLCPHLYVPDKNGAVDICCDYPQLARFDKQISVPRQLMTRCPACWLGFRTFLCDFTCSPRQHEFMLITDDEPYNSTKPSVTRQVKSVDYYITNTSMTDMYNSCLDVQYPASNSKVLDLLCGTNVEDCSPLKLATYLGTNDLTPFLFNTYLVNDSSIVNGSYAVNSTVSVRPCNSTMYGCGRSFSTPFMNASACGCSDCQDSCPVPRPPPVPYVCKVWGADCVSLVCGLLFVVFATVFVITVLVGNVMMARRRRNSYSINVRGEVEENSKHRDEEANKLVPNGGAQAAQKTGCMNRIGIMTEAFLTKVFER
jgi:Niemann-Pick C1 protein